MSAKKKLAELKAKRAQMMREGVGSGRKWTWPDLAELDRQIAEAEAKQ